VWLSVIFAVCAALSNATASVLQRKGARREPRDESMSLAMLWDLVHQPAWVGGVSSILIGFAFQVAALATGPITLIQPILVMELTFTMVLSSVVLRAQLHAREWAAVVGMSAGVALLLVGLHPSKGDTNSVPGVMWALGSGVTLAVIAILLLLAYRHQYAARAAYLGVSCGLYFGFVAALVAGMTAVIPAGISAVFSAWQTYAIILAGPLGFFLLQSTLRAGRLIASQPGLTLANPLVGIGWGVAVFGEQVRGGGWIAAEVAGAAAVAACTLLLVRSPLLHGSEGVQEEAGAPGDQEEAGTGTAERTQRNQ
jgi:drug/metabolite transporter (DMT)-like permease